MFVRVLFQQVLHTRTGDTPVTTFDWCRILEKTIDVLFFSLFFCSLEASHDIKTFQYMWRLLVCISPAPLWRFCLCLLSTHIFPGCLTKDYPCFFASRFYPAWRSFNLACPLLLFVFLASSFFFLFLFFPRFFVLQHFALSPLSTIIPQGGLVPGHVLIVPVSHQQRYSELSPEGAKEAERYKESFSRYDMIRYDMISYV